MKILLLTLAAGGLIVVLVAVAGALLPREHQVVRRATFRRSVGEVHAVVRDFAAQPTWRAGLRAVELLPVQDGVVRYREISGDGAVNYRLVEDRPGRKLVVRIDDDALPYGGIWTFDFDEDRAGCTVTITEDGFVKNVIFRFLARFVFGYTSTMEGYLRDLGKKWGETPEIRG